MKEILKDEALILAKEIEIRYLNGENLKELIEQTVQKIKKVAEATKKNNSI